MLLRDADISSERSQTLYHTIRMESRRYISAWTRIIGESLNVLTHNFHVIVTMIYILCV